MASRGLRFGTGLLAKDLVGHLTAPLRVHELSRGGRQLAQRFACQFAYAGGRKIEHLPDLLVALVLPKDDLDDRALIGSQLVKRGHRTREVNFLGVPDEPTYAIPMEEVLEGTLNFEYLEADSESARGRFEVNNRHKQPFGIVHGGVYSAFAEGLCSFTTYMNVREQGKIAVGSSNFTSFLRPVMSGVVTAEARALHRGRTSWVWECEFRNEEGKLCAASRVTLAVIDPPTRPGNGS